MKIIFLGTPDFAVPVMEALIRGGHNIVAAVTQPDRKGNRGVVTPCPVKLFAEGRGIPVYQYERISREGVADMQNIEADIMVTAAFGQILSDELLAMKKFGVINVHGSLLPKYRGASPIQAAILNGDTETGITIMRTAKAVDSGEIIYVLKTPISEMETAGELFDRLSVLGGQALLTALELIESGKAVYTPQNHSDATFCKMLTKESGKIHWTICYNELSSFVRGMTPWPSAFSFLCGKRVKIKKISKVCDSFGTECGKIILADTKKGVNVIIKDAVIRLELVQFENSKEMTDTECVCGRKFTVGEVFE